jgi:transposase
VVAWPSLNRKLQILGYDARLIPTKHFRPYSKGKKKDFRDAEENAEADCVIFAAQ